MAINLLRVLVKHEKRIRAVFSTPLASGAFGVPGPACYAITSLDSAGPEPTVVAAMVVPGSASVVELVLSTALVKGGLYRLTTLAVPAIAGSAFSPLEHEDFRYSFSTIADNSEPVKRDRERLLYGIDLLWNGVDYQETASGDLDRVGGTANVTKALNRGVESGGLPWDPSWGAGAREYIDSPSVAAGSLKGAISAQMLRDPRVKGAKVTFEINDSNTSIHADASLISGELLERISQTVPNE